MRDTGRRFSPRVTWILVLLALCAAMPGIVAIARATSMRSFDLDGLVAASTEIVVGRVESTRSRWDRDHTMILTEVTIAVDENLKGAAPRRLTVYQPGGQVGNERIEVDGCANFGAVNEEGVFFLCRDRAGHAMLTGLAQGKFDIERDRGTGAAFVQRRQAGFQARDLHSLRPVVEGEPAPRFGLQEFLSTVRKAVSVEGAR